MTDEITVTDLSPQLIEVSTDGGPIKIHLSNPPKGGGFRIRNMGDHAILDGARVEAGEYTWDGEHLSAR